MPLRLRSRHLALPAFSVGLALFFGATNNACGGKIDTTETKPLPTTLVEPTEPRDASVALDGARVPDARAPLPPQTQATEVDLGTVPAGGTVTLAVPPNALGFNVVVTGDVDDEVGVESMRSPSGEVVHREHIVVGGTFETSLSTEIAAASVPQNKLASTMPLEPGVWSITLSSRAGKAVRAKARIQISGDGVFHGGAADMHVYLPKGLEIEDPDVSHVVTAASAPTDRSLEVRLDSFFRTLEATAGIKRGAVTFHDADPGLVRISTERTLDVAFAASKGVVSDGEQSIHILFTNELDFGEGTWGIASGIPGAATRTGTKASGVTLALTPDTFGDMDGLALLHEVGHFVGLNHTTEFVGGFVDPLEDTPSCAGILDMDRPETLNRCPDKDNLMFPTLWGDSVRLTDSQKLVYRGSPTYKAFVGEVPKSDAGATDAGESEGGVFPGLLPPERPGSNAFAKGNGKLRFTKSGRALSASERFVLGGLCAGSPLDLRRMQGHLGPMLARAELTRIATDADLLGVIRMRARKMLARASR
jgi:hypothetical protein